MHIQRGVKFLLHKRDKGDSKNLAIRMRVTLRGQTPIDFPTGYNIDTADWDMENQCALPSYEYATDINRTIDEWKSVMNEIFARYELLEKRIPTPGEIKDLFNDMVGRKTKTNADLPSCNDNFFNVYDLFTDEMGKRNQWTDSTHEKFAALRRHLYEYDPNISFPALTERKLQGYVDSLLRKDLRNTTISKNLSLRSLYFYAFVICFISEA